MMLAVVEEETNKGHAEIFCKNHGAILVQPIDAAETKLVADFVANKIGEGHHVFIGVEDADYIPGGQ